MEERTGIKYLFYLTLFCLISFCTAKLFSLYSELENGENYFATEFDLWLIMLALSFFSLVLFFAYTRKPKKPETQKSTPNTSRVYEYKLITPYGPIYADVLPDLLNDLFWDIKKSDDAESKRKATLAQRVEDDKINPCSKSIITWQQFREMLDIVGFPKDGNQDEIIQIRKVLEDNNHEQPFAIRDGHLSSGGFSTTPPCSPPENFEWMMRRYPANSFTVSEQVSRRRQFWFLVRAPK